MTEFKNRGHFCNYCRKILSNKSPQHIDINPAIWTVWDSNDKVTITEFVLALSNTKYDETLPKPIKNFNKQLKIIIQKYANQKYIDVVNDKRWKRIK